MKENKMLDSMEYVDAEWITESAEPATVRKPIGWKKWTAAAACACLVVTGGVGAAKIWGGNGHVEEALLSSEKSSKEETFETTTAADEDSAMLVTDVANSLSDFDIRASVSANEGDADIAFPLDGTSLPPVEPVMSDGAGAPSTKPAVTDRIPTLTTESDSTASQPKQTATTTKQVQRTVDESEDAGYSVWNEKNVSVNLCRKLDQASDDEVFVLQAIFRWDNSFVYQGKTLGEYELAMSDERILPEKLMMLMKCGDELKYGKALYTTGTPDGIRWAKEWYEETVAFYGQELLDKYLVNGNFLRDKLEQDIQTAKNADIAQKAYDKAAQAYLTQMAGTIKGASHEGNDRCLTFRLTKSEFAALTIENQSEFFFSEFTQNTDEERYVVVENATESE